ncbi:MAG TPA: DNA (cytosine-5-)-methyltransferase [Candidatus Paceibacterota bacterium]
MKKVRVVELFAGVGGFRLGLDAASNSKLKYETVWSSQWEPRVVAQHASQIYAHVFGVKNHSCEDIQMVIEKDFQQIPNHDLLVGGFPCQDYSVATTLNQAKGINGKKGALWWSIFNILKKKESYAPNFLMLENVDRLLKSPSQQRGRDFAIMLASLADLGYAVEWRVINAADYGFPQRRRRIFIIGYKNDTKLFKNVKKAKDLKDWIHQEGIISQAFPIKKIETSLRKFEIKGDLKEISENFSSGDGLKSPFENSGVMIGRVVYTVKTTPEYEGKSTLLKDILISEEKIPEEFFIEDKDIKKWEYLKGAKKEKRKSADGFEYHYSEGPMIFPDLLDRPSRTIVTGEGGRSPSRFKHVIKTESGRLRRLLPIELERLNMFPDDHTKLMSNGKETSDTKRAFIMGNALVVGVIEKLAKSLSNFI